MQHECGRCLCASIVLVQEEKYEQVVNEKMPTWSNGPSITQKMMDCDLLIRYRWHFIKFVKPSKSHPVLVLLDGQQSHKSLEAVELARKHNITMITIPPHTSH